MSKEKIMTWPKETDGLPMFMSSRHLAQLRGTTERTIERERQNGDGIQFVKWGRKVYYKSEDVLAFLEARTFTSTAEARLRTADAAEELPRGARRRVPTSEGRAAQKSSPKATASRHHPACEQSNTAD